MPRWIQKWKVPSSSRDAEYTVSIGENGEWGCSCKHWIHRRTDCRHIKEKRQELGAIYSAKDAGMSSQKKPLPSARPADTFLKIRTKPAQRLEPTPPRPVFATRTNRATQEEATRIISLDDDF